MLHLDTSRAIDHLVARQVQSESVIWVSVGDASSHGLWQIATACSCAKAFNGFLKLVDRIL